MNNNINKLINMNFEDVITLRINNEIDRKNIILALANNGYRVWVECKKKSSTDYTDDYDVNFYLNKTKDVILKPIRIN